MRSKQNQKKRAGYQKIAPRTRQKKDDAPVAQIVQAVADTPTPAAIAAEPEAVTKETPKHKKGQRRKTGVSSPTPAAEVTASAPPSTDELKKPVGDAYLDLFNTQRVALYDGLLERGKWDNEKQFKVAVGMFEGMIGIPFMKWDNAIVKAFCEQNGIAQ